MSDNYQAVYDAVRSRFHPVDMAEIARNAFANFDAYAITAAAQNAFIDIAQEANRPFVLLKPSIQPDGNHWCVLYGANLQEGVAGFGDTPDKAARAFDVAWNTARADAKEAKTL